MVCLRPLVLLAAAAFLPAQDGITTARIFEDGLFAADALPPMQWHADGSGYTVVEPGRRGGHEIVEYALPGGERRVLVTASQLAVPGSGPLPIAAYAWSADRNRLLVFTNTRKVWRLHTRGDYWVLDLRTDAPPHKLGGDAPDASLMFAKFAPDGGSVAFVRDNDLWVEDLDAGEVRRLTQDGSATTINGTFDWVYEEEFFLRDGFRWSPDGKHIAFWQLDTTGIGTFPLVDNLSQPYARVIELQYPKVGTTNAAARVGVIPRAGGAPVWAKLPGDARQQYPARMDWADNSGELVVQQLDRRQKENRVQLVTAATGDVRTLLVDQDDTWVEVVDDFVWLDGGKRFTWVSERDGWRHLWLGQRDGSEPVLVTPEAWDVMGVPHIDRAGKGAYVIASPQEPTRRFLYRVAMDGSAATRLTPETTGVNEYDVAPDGRHAVWTHSSFREPPTVRLVSLPDHRVLRTLVDNAALRARVKDLALGKSEFLRVPGAEGAELDGWVMYPPDFDPARKWPVVWHVYGEPWKQTVLDQWGTAFQPWHWLLTQRGYVVISVDNHGTPAPRGRAWRKSIYRQIGVLASQDQAAACRGLLARFPWMDRERLGVWGWSGGGSMTLNLMFRSPELFRAGVAVSFVADMRLYDTIYQERYMDLPELNPDGYQAGSPIHHAAGLRGDLLLVYGTGDDNCHYQNMEVLVDELVRLGKPFSMLAYPNRTHAIREREGTQVHHFESMTRFLCEKLPPGPR